MKILNCEEYFLELYKREPTSKLKINTAFVTSKQISKEQYMIKFGFTFSSSCLLKQWEDKYCQ